MTAPAAVPRPDDHPCGLDGEQRMCIDGKVYGPCEHPDCSGVCDYERDCDCPCHRSGATSD